ncbi:hypothetical protein [Paenibacillus sp. FJAT-27812]|uniref:hypothetical protein n=1 Tax=Paenibacillus sp. FJAT-27812 TaxID=1684143 RepID=UPI0006A7B850|nr:hypothetical protein [Paenibacillus sp. FJAT-27812]
MNHPRKPPEQRLFDPDTFEDETTWKTLNTHDPGIFKDSGSYYTFSTDAMYRENERPLFAEAYKSDVQRILRIGNGLVMLLMAFLSKRKTGPGLTGYGRLM